MLYFCTYFDQHYLSRGLALINSLRQHCQAFRLYVLCLDQECYTRLAQLHYPELCLIRLCELERAIPDLAAAKYNRSLIEYYFTCSPALPWYILNRDPEPDLITYIDADMYFFGDPALILDELGTHSIGVIEHRYPTYLQEMNRYGVYNVGMLMFRRDEQGLACLRWWLDRCLEWCHDELDGERYADQKYLEQWPALFSNLVVIQHKGVNTAPWNMMNYTFSLRDGRVFVDDQPLLLFHFHGLKQKKPWLYDTHTARYKTTPSRVARYYIFRPYIGVLAALTLASALSNGVRYQSSGARQQRRISKLYRIAHYIRGVLYGQYLLCLNGQVLLLLLFLGGAHATSLFDVIIQNEALLPALPL